VAATSLTADEIMHRYYEISYSAGDDMRAQISMVITDGQGRTRERSFSMIRKDIGDSGKQLYFVYFHKPSDIRKATFLVHKFIHSDDDRWMYLPSLDLVKRIAASDKRTSFMGSHYFYEDISGRNLDYDIHEILAETAEVYLIRNTPVDPDSVEFSTYTIWVDKETFLPHKAEFYDKQGKPYRQVEVLEQEMIQGYPTLTKVRVNDGTGGGNTITEFSKVEYDINLSDSLFT
jgi:outer membrane lipoprotein-sorting protein